MCVLRNNTACYYLGICIPQRTYIQVVHSREYFVPRLARRTAHFHPSLHSIRSTMHSLLPHAMLAMSDCVKPTHHTFNLLRIIRRIWQSEVAIGHHMARLPVAVTEPKQN
jgi:hypothetical protein